MEKFNYLEIRFMEKFNFWKQTVFLQKKRQISLIWKLENFWNSLYVHEILLLSFFPLWVSFRVFEFLGDIILSCSLFVWPSFLWVSFSKLLSYSLALEMFVTSTFLFVPLLLSMRLLLNSSRVCFDVSKDSGNSSTFTPFIVSDFSDETVPIIWLDSCRIKESSRSFTRLLIETLLCRRLFFEWPICTNFFF